MAALKTLQLKPLLLLALIVPFGLAESSFAAQSPRHLLQGSASDAGQRSARRSLNQNPKRAVELGFKIAHAPGAFAKVEGVVQYDVSNAAQCGMADEQEGNVPYIISNEPIRLTQSASGEYRGMLYLDQIVDEDYYGRGVCHWVPTEVRVALVRGDDPQDTRFVSKLSADLLNSGAVQTRYFWSGYYPQAGMTGYAEFGNLDIEKVRARIPRRAKQDIFTTIMTVKPVQR